ncbi:MAG: glycyl-radical enzyme activating protein [Firmicutes bacterium]|nr:glycyl-radical enzyme activating protein [Bacillota bacterium]
MKELNRGFDKPMQNSGKAFIFDIQTLSTHDGPGIRTTVFMKGCPLKCTWCSNPEGQAPFPQLRFYKNRCRSCSACALACPDCRILSVSGYPVFNRNYCRFCRSFSCADACPYDALTIAGYETTADELLKTLLKDIRLYRNSGGGITFSGGEPLIQADFLITVCEKLKNLGINIAIETCGAVDSKNAAEVLSFTDTIFFDLKHTDDNKHKEFTGISNSVILKNLTAVSELHSERTIVSIPLIPGFNDTKDEMEAIGRFIRDTGLKKFRILPYHAMGSGKYETLGVNYPHAEYSQKINPDFLGEMTTMLSDMGLIAFLE